MTRALVACAAALLLFACGTPPAQNGGGGSVGFELYISRVALDRVGAFQLSIVRDGAKYSGAELTKTCLNEGGIGPSDLVPIEDADGKSHPALIVPVALNGSGAQDTVMRNVATGTGYLLVVEAISKESPPRFLGATFKDRLSVNSGNNETVLLNPINLVDEADGGTPDAGLGLPTCDPRFEK